MRGGEGETGAKFLSTDYFLEIHSIKGLNTKKMFGMNILEFFTLPTESPY